MALRCGTHSGSFHADDVLAFGLIRTFEDPDAVVVRTRDLEVLDTCDVVFDVGGIYDPERGRFDHHQNEYQGPLSSAGMVLEWLEGRARIEPELALRLRRELVDYVDAVDNGRHSPDGRIPCFTSIVGTMNNELDDGSGHDERYAEAADIATRYLRGIAAGHRADAAARETVRQAMEEAAAAGRRTIYLDAYVPWKPAYFDLGGRDHPTDFVMFPAEDSWRVIAIPPELGSFAKKVPFPESWAGLSDAELEAATGVEGSRFCHKNRFIAVFETREGALEAMARAGLG
ncbi:MAG: hypothetical protein RL562_2050 [Planctomycetota bacterium]|jgi:uncharacterized UPF0160 family protein